MNKIYEVVVSRKEVFDCKYKCYIPAINESSAKAKALDGDWNAHEVMFRDMNDSSQVHIHNVREGDKL
tara:strand:+ start:417 stop:620 length:204 start_codon:yes stop_codon:yes gene_type:complete